MSDPIAHPAQPDNLTANDVADMIVQCYANFYMVEKFLRLERRPKPTERQAAKRMLAGIIATCETIRLSIKD